MSIRVSFGTLASDQRVGADLPKDDTPFRIAVVGDFSGRGARGLIATAEEIGRRRARKVDRANLDDLIVKSAPAIEVDTGAGSGAVALAFRSLDDFHPDAIHGRVDAFADCFDRDEKTALMNAILHDPAFQALEAAWRGVDWLLQGVAKCGPVEVRLVDLSADELRADLGATDRLEETGLYQVLVDQPASRGDLDPWTVVVGLDLFEPTAADAATLGRVGRVARQASAPYLAGASPRVLGPTFAPEEEDAEAWEALRQLPESSLLGLAAPRFLLRPPYGEATRTIDAFEYEEYTGPKGWAGYLWGNPALACAVLLARSFAKEGWAFRPGSVLDLGGMVMHVTRDEDDEPVSVLAESRLIRPAAERLSGLGLMPLLCVKGRDAAELACVQSLARPPKGEKTSPLLGRWGQKGSVNLPRSGAPDPGARTAAAAAPPPPAAPNATAPEAPDPTAPEEMDPELAALMAELDGGTSAASEPEQEATEPEPAPESAEPEMDPELAALMAELDGGGSADPEPEPEPEPEPAEPEMDPELAALMAELDGGSSPEPEPEPAAEPEMDPELAALMAEMDGTAPASGSEAEAGPAGDDEDLDALMNQLG